MWWSDRREAMDGIRLGAMSPGAPGFAQVSDALGTGKLALGRGTHPSTRHTVVVHRSTRVRQ